VPKAELLANLLVGLAALKDKGIELQKESNSFKDIIDEHIVEMFRTMRPNFKLEPFFHGDIKDKRWGGSL